MSSPYPRSTPAGGMVRASSGSTDFASPDFPASWATMPRLESPIADLSTGQLAIPWMHFMTFLGARAAFLATVQGNVSLLQSQVQTLQQNVATLQGQVGTLQGQVSTLEGQTSSLQSQINTINGEIGSINSQISALNGSINNLQGQINTINTRLANAGIP